MKKLSTTILMTFLNLLIAGGSAGSFSATYLVDNKLSYTSEGQVKEDNGCKVKVSSIIDLDGRAVVIEKSVFEPDSYSIIELQVRDTISGRQEIIIKNDDGYLIKYRKDRSSKFCEKIIKSNEPAIHGSIVPLYIVDNIDKIYQKGYIDFPLIIPEQMTIYNFQAKICGKKSINGNCCYDIIMEPTNWVVRQFVPPIHFYYGEELPHFLEAYEGPLAPCNSEGKKQSGEIFFSYD